MIELDNQQKIKILNLFNNKRFSELEIEIESISKTGERSPFLSNLLGVAKIEKKTPSQSDFENAMKLFREAITGDSLYEDALCNYALLGLKLNKHEEPFDLLKQFLKKGYKAKSYLVLARIYYMIGETDEALELLKIVIDKKEASIVPATHFLSALNYTTKYNQSYYLEFCKKINEQFEPNDTLNLKNFSFDKKTKVLEIGWLSPDFCNHAIAQYLLETLVELKKYNFKLHAFNLRNPRGFDEITKKYKDTFHNWHDVSLLTDFEIANFIREKKIHFLFDLTGYFTRNRFRVLKYKPAPIQVLWLGYLNTTGIKEVDYIISDQNLIHKGEEKLYSEKIINPSKIWNAHSKINYNLKVQELPFNRNNFFTFGCLNNSSKISKEVVDAWGKILSKVKNSRLLLKAVNKDSEIAYKNILRKLNIKSSRVVFLSAKSNKEDHYKTYNDIDLALDTFPYPGVTTSFEAIWMGVPVLTMKGDNSVSRCGESININLDLKNFIAKNPREYVDKAVLFSKNINELSKIRKSLREKALASPLFDVENFAKNLSNQINKIWLNHPKK